MPKNKYVIQAETKGFNKAKGDTKQLSGAMGGLAKNVGLVAGSYFAGKGLINAFQFATRVGKEFEQSMANLKAISGANAKEMERLSANAKQLGASTRYTASQIGELSVNYAKLGFSASQILKVSEATLNLASATGEDLAQSSAVAGGTLRGFGLEAEQTGMLTDVMAKSFSTSALDLNKFSEAMKYVAPVSKVAGFSVQETTAILGQLANSSIDGSMAGTSLRVVLMEMSISGSKLSNVFGKSINNFEEFVQVLHDTKKQGGLTDAQLLKIPKLLRGTIPVLIESSDKMMEYKDSLDKAGGSAKKMADIQMDTLEGKMLEFNSALEGVGIALFEMMEEPLKDVTESLTEFAQGMDAERMKSYASGLGLVALAFGVYNTQVIIATVSTKTFSKAIITTGVGALAVTVGILIGKLIELSGFFDDVTVDANDSADAIERSRKASQDYQDTISDMGIKKVAEEMKLAKEDLTYYTDELKLQKSELKNLSGSYEDYIRNRRDDSIATKNLLSEYDAYLSRMKMFPSVTGEATMSLEEWNTKRDEESGTVQDGIQSYEDWQNIVIKQGMAVQGNIKITEENIKQIKAEIKALEKRNKVVDGGGGGDDKISIMLEVASVEEQIHAKKLQQIAEQGLAFKDLGISEVEAQLWATEQIEALNLQRLESYSQFYGFVEAGYDTFINTLLDKEMTGKERREAIWESMQKSFVSMLGDLLKEWIKNQIARMLFAKTSEATAIASSIATGSAIALAYAPASASVSLATLGANSITANAGITSTHALTKSLAMLEDGGLIMGASHSGGGVNINAEGGEFVMRKEAVSQIGVEQLSQMNEGGGGGITLNISAPLIDDTIIDVIVPAIERAKREGLA
ncbi:phage tail tape measure protein [Candidatus Woesebacteria bacterium]|nr:phage tail tape measure protein [Candidatus Woesebacteria bacterium]